MHGVFVIIGVMAVGAGAVLAGRRLRGGERREAIDIDLVLEEKYPNRRARREQGRARGATAPRAVGRVPVTVGTVAVAATDSAPPADPGTAAAPEPAPEGRGATARAWPEPAAPARWIAPPDLDLPPWAPIPGEPGDYGLVGPPRRPARVVDTEQGPGLAASPYEALRRRRERLAKQVAQAFADVHRTRTESLRRASQAEHNAELATSARVRATRMAQESRRYEAQGRRRSAAVPDAGDAFHDVHRFRVEALRRAHEAEHGAESVSRVRERAARLLEELRRIDAEMARLHRGVETPEIL